MSPAHWTPGDWAVFAAAMYAAILSLAAWAYGHLRYKTGWEDGRDYQTGRDINARLRDISRNMAGIQAETGPLPLAAPRQDQDFRAGRKTGGGLGGPPLTIPPRTARGNADGGRIVFGAGAPAAAPAPRSRVVTKAVTADDIPPVICPEPGTAVPMAPQPAPEPGRRTAAMTALSDTGEMAALTNRRIHEMRYEGERYREGLRARFAADAARPDGPATGPASGAGPLGEGRRP